jgi:hypothetical protein
MHSYLPGLLLFKSISFFKLITHFITKAIIIDFEKLYFICENENLISIFTVLYNGFSLLLFRKIIKCIDC